MAWRNGCFGKVRSWHGHFDCGQQLQRRHDCHRRTLRLGNAFALGATTGNLAINSSTVDMNGFSASVGTFSGASGALVTLLTSTGTSTLTTGGATNSTYAGVLSDGSGKLALTVAGSGTLALTGSNSYSGGTTISNGTVQLGASSRLQPRHQRCSYALGTGGLTMNSGTLNLDDYNVTIVGAISGTGGTITDLSPGHLRLQPDAHQRLLRRRHRRWQRP